LFVWERAKEGARGRTRVWSELVAPEGRRVQWWWAGRHAAGVAVLDADGPRPCHFF